MKKLLLLIVLTLSFQSVSFAYAQTLQRPKLTEIACVFLSDPSGERTFITAVPTGSIDKIDQLHDLLDSANEVLPEGYEYYIDHCND